MIASYLRRHAFGVVVVLVALMACTLPMLAQQTLGSINGTVLDPAGASVARATITVTNAQIDLSRTVKSEANGFYQIFNLPIGTYQVKVGGRGF